MVNMSSNMTAPRFFQRRHFKLMAELVRTSDVPPKEKLVMACHFARYLKYTNANFDQAKFLKACGFIPLFERNQTEFDITIVHHAPTGLDWQYVGDTR